MNWSPAKASTWLRRFADDVAGDSYKDGGSDDLYASAGAAYYAVLHGVGYNTRAEFSDFFIEHMGLDESFLEEALYEIEKSN